MSALRVARTATPREPAGEWAAARWLSEPAASWRVTLPARATGEVVRTRTGGEARSAVRIARDGTSGSGTPVPAGGYTWRLTATPADGTGPDATASGGREGRRLWVSRMRRPPPRSGLRGGGRRPVGRPPGRAADQRVKVTRCSFKVAQLEP